MTDETRAKREWVYFAQVDGGELIKIGTSREPERRMDKLGTEVRRMGIGRRAMLLAIIPGGVGVERWMHARFADRHIVGEWFEAGGLLADFLAVIGDFYATRSETVAAVMRGREPPIFERRRAALALLGVPP